MKFFLILFSKKVFIDKDEMPDSYFFKLDDLMKTSTDLIDQLDKRFKEENIIILKSSHLGKSTLAIQYANHFSSQCKHNFVYFMKGSEHLFFEYKHFSQLLNIECSAVEEYALVKRVYKEIVRRSWNPQTKIMFILDDCNSSVASHYLKHIPNNLFVLITTNDEIFNSEITFNRNIIFQINQHSTPSNLESMKTNSIINDLSETDQWEVLKYFAVLDSAFMPIDILKILVENKNCLPFEHSNLFKTAELNGMKGFMIHSTIQKEIIDFLSHQNEMEPIIERLSNKIECLVSLASNNKVYYYNIFKMFEFLICSATNSLEVKANWLFSFGEFLLKWHNYSGAIDCFEKSFNLLHQEKCRIKMAEISMQINKHEQALVHYKFVNEAWNGWDEEILFNIGLCYFNLRDYNKSYDYFQESLSLKQSSYKSNSLSYAINLKLIGMVHLENKEFKKAIELFDKSLISYREIDTNLNEISQVLTNKSLAYLRLAQTEKAIELAEESLVMRKTLEANLNTADTMKIIGEAYYIMGKYKLSLKYYEQSFKLIKQFVQNNDQNSISLAICLHELGKCNKSLGRHKKALDYYKEALKVYQGIYNEKTCEKLDEVLAWINAGHIYDNLGKAIKAIELYEKSLEFLRKV